MDYHPKEILVTAVYLATKVEEFNVSIRDTNYPLINDKPLSWVGGGYLLGLSTWG